MSNRVYRCSTCKLTVHKGWKGLAYACLNASCRGVMRHVGPQEDRRHQIAKQQLTSYGEAWPQ